MSKPRSASMFVTREACITLPLMLQKDSASIVLLTDTIAAAAFGRVRRLPVTTFHETGILEKNEGAGILIHELRHDGSCSECLHRIGRKREVKDSKFLEGYRISTPAGT